MVAPLLAAGLVSAGAGIIGGLMQNSAAQKGNALALQGQRETNQTNIMLQRENRDWEANMSNTEVQRRIKDLEAAGLNPMLAYSGQASTPTTAAAHVENPTAHYANRGSQVGQAVSTALGIAQLKANVENVMADTATKRAAAGLTEEQTRNAAYQTAISANTASQVGVTNQQQWYTLQETRKRIENIIQEMKIKDEAITAGRLTNEQTEKLMPYIIEYQKADAAIRGLNVSEAKATADFYDTTGSAGKYIDAAGNALGIGEVLKKILKTAPVKTIRGVKK